MDTNTTQTAVAQQPVDTTTKQTGELAGSHSLIVFPAKWRWHQCCEWLDARGLYRKWDGQHGLINFGNRWVSL